LIIYFGLTALGYSQSAIKLLIKRHVIIILLSEVLGYFIRHQVLVSPCQAFIFFIGKVKSVLVFRIVKSEYVEGKSGSWHSVKSYSMV